jgi:hypothetical protein
MAFSRDCPKEERWSINQRLAGKQHARSPPASCWDLGLAVSSMALRYTRSRSGITWDRPRFRRSRWRRCNRTWPGTAGSTWPRLVLTIVGVYLLLGHARTGRLLPDNRSFTGQLLLGWGAFNLVEGIIDHHLLEIHHVRDLPMHVPLYDWLFLGIGGVGLLVIGWWLARPEAEVRRA